MSVESRAPRFQILSNLYLDDCLSRLREDFPVEGDFLILAGNICKLTELDFLRAWLQKQVLRFATIYFVPGDYEFYGASVNEGNSQTLKLEGDSSLRGRFRLLDRRNYIVPGTNVAIMGCTYWLLNDGHNEARYNTNKRRIKNLESENVYNLHAMHSVWLEEQIKDLTDINKIVREEFKRQLLVVTNYEPPSKLREYNAQHKTDSPLRKVDAWVHGGTQTAKDEVVDGVRYVCNPRGLSTITEARMDAPGEGFAVTKTIEVGKFL